MGQSGLIVKYCHEIIQYNNPYKHIKENYLGKIHGFKNSHMILIICPQIYLLDFFCKEFCQKIYLFSSGVALTMCFTQTMPPGSRIVL